MTGNLDNLGNRKINANVDNHKKKKKKKFGGEGGNVSDKIN